MADRLDFAVQRKNLHEQVADKIENLVILESFKSGDKLPSERELAEKLKVSRTVIREATRVLKVRGIVKIQPGKGTYIQSLNPALAAEPIERLLKHQPGSNTFENLCEVRKALEIDIAGYAASRANEQDIQFMETTIQKMSEFADNEVLFTQSDLEFHMAMAKATHNSIFQVLLHPISDLLLEFRLKEYRSDPSGSVQGGLDHHRKILLKVKAHDIQGARQAMEEHLNQAEFLFNSAKTIL